MHSWKDVELAGLLIRPLRLFSNENIDTRLMLKPEKFWLTKLDLSGVQERQAIERVSALNDQEQSS